MEILRVMKKISIYNFGFTPKLETILSCEDLFINLNNNEESINHHYFY